MYVARLLTLNIVGDVFRPPPHLTAFAAFVGTGVQLLAMAVTLMLWTIVGDLYIGMHRSVGKHALPFYSLHLGSLERATMLTASIFIYALTSVISYVVGLTLWQIGLDSQSIFYH